MKYSEWQILTYIIEISWHFLVTNKRNILQKYALFRQSVYVLQQYHSKWYACVSQSKSINFSSNNIQTHAFQIYDAV